MSGAGSRGSTAKVVCKAAGCGKEQSRPDAMRRHKTRAHVKSIWQKRAVSQSPSSSSDVNMRQEINGLIATRKEGRVAPVNREAGSRAGRCSCNHQDRRAKMEKQRRSQTVNSHDAPPIPASGMLHRQESAADTAGPRNALTKRH